jgi:hypothetical protein
MADSFKQAIYAETVIPIQVETDHHNQQIIYVNPSQGNDQVGQGTPNSPLKTITQALTIAIPQTQIILAEGRYTTATGEKFPLVIDQPIILHGNPQSQGKNVIIEGNGLYLSPTAAGQNVAIAVIANATIEGITVSNSHPRGHGIWVESANPLINHNTLSGNGLFDIKNITNNTITAVGNQIEGKISGKINLQGTYNNSASTSQSGKNSTQTEQKSTANLVASQMSPPLNHIATNNSLFDSLPQSQPTMPPLPTKTPAREEITIAGSLTPKRPLSNGNKAIVSSQVLPEPPVVSEPYRQPESMVEESYTSQVAVTSNSEVVMKSSSTILNNKNTRYHRNLSQTKPIIMRATNSNHNYIAPEPVSVSPFDQTPSHDANLTEPTKISLNPNSINQTNSNKIKPQTNQQNHQTASTHPAELSEKITNATTSQSYVNSSQKRRTLNDILVFAPNRNQSNPSYQDDDNSSLSTNNSTTYKVLVSTADSTSESQVKSLYPDAFRTNYQGKSFLQVGLFSSRDNAEQVLNSLRNYGLNPIIIP